MSPASARYASGNCGFVGSTIVLTNTTYTALCDPFRLELMGAIAPVALGAGSQTINLVAHDRKRQLKAPIDKHLKQEVIACTTGHNTRLQGTEFELLGVICCSQHVGPVAAIYVQRPEANILTFAKVSQSIRSLSKALAADVRNRSKAVLGRN